MIRRLPPFLILLATPVAADKVTYEDHILPIFQQACLNCHNPDKTRGGLDLSTFGGAMKGGSGGKVVEPGDTGSTLISLIKQSAEPKMPPEGDKLSPAQIAAIEQWIEGGLLETQSSAARKPSKPKFETALRSDPAAKPDGPPPMPIDVLLEPPVVTSRASAVHGLAASPWAPLLAVTGQRQVLLFDTGSLELVGILPFPEGDPIALAFTPDGRYLMVGGGIPGKSGVTVTFDVTSGERLLVAGREFDAVLASDIRPSFDLVVTGSPSRLLKLWNTETGELVISVKKHTDWITALDLSPDGVLLASGDRNGGLWVWESDTAKEFHTLRGHEAAISAATFRADSNVLATASEDGTVRFWEMNGGNEIKKNDAHPGGVTAFSFARDGRSVTAGRDLKVKVWKADFNHERDLAQDLPALPTAVALDAEATRAFVADAEGTIRVFATADGASLGEIMANPPTIEARLVSLFAEIEEQQSQLASAQALTKERHAAIEATRTVASKAEAKLHQAREIRGAAQAGATEARQRLEEYRHHHSASREQIAAAEAARDEARRQVDVLAAVAEEGRDQPTMEDAIAALASAEAEFAKLQKAFADLMGQEKRSAEALHGADAALAAAEARIKPAEEAQAAAATALLEAEKTAAEAVAAEESARGSLTRLEKARKHWIAAGVNTLRLTAAEHAQESELAGSALLDEYTAALAALEEPRAALQAKRAERERLATHFAETPTSSPIEEERQATLIALDRVISRMEEAYAELEQEILRLRFAGERRVIDSYRATRQVQALRQAYQLASQ